MTPKVILEQLSSLLIIRPMLTEAPPRRASPPATWTTSESCLRIQAAIHGRSMEDEARDILRSSLNQEPQGPKNLTTAINALFKPFGGFDLPEVPREPMREPPTFDD